MGILLWHRRCLAALPVYAALVALTLLRNGDGWPRLWPWLVSTVNGSTMLLSPAVAAIVVLCITRRWPAAVRRELPAGMGMRGMAHIVAAQLLHAWSALLLGGAVGAAVCWAAHAAPGRSWPPAQVAAALAVTLAAAAFGAAAATISESVTVVPFVFLIVFLAHRGLWEVSGPQFLSFDPPTGLAANCALDPARLHWEIGGNVALAVGLGAVAGFRESRGPTAKFGSAMMAVIALLATAVVSRVVTGSPYYVCAR